MNRSTAPGPNSEVQVRCIPPDFAPRGSRLLDHETIVAMLVFGVIVLSAYAGGMWVLKWAVTR